MKIGVAGDGVGVVSMPLSGAVDATITASTTGSRLSARAELRERSGSALIYDAVVEVHRSDGEGRQCGTAVVTIRIARPVPSSSSPEQES